MSYRSRKHNYAKNYIDNLFYKLNGSCQVVMKKLILRDIENYKLSLIKNKEITIKQEIEIFKKDTTLNDNATSKEDKTPTDDKTFNDDTTSKEDKMSTDDKPFIDDTTSKEDKTSTDDKMSTDDKTSTEDKTSTDDKMSTDDKTSTEDKTSTGHKISKNDKKPKEIKTSKDDKTSKENTDEPAIKKQKLGTDERDALKLVLFREGETHKFKSQFKSSLKLNNEIASTSTEEVSTKIVCEELAKSENSPDINDKQLIWITDVKEMMDEHNYRRWMEMIGSGENPNDKTNGMKKLAVAKLPTSGPKVNAVKQRPLKSRKYVIEYLIKIENLYKKYFTKSIKDTIVIIANVLNVIALSNRHHKTRIEESFKKKTEAEKLKERCDANRLYVRHNKILETMLKGNFIDIVASFEVLDFKTSFQMFFLSVLTVLRVLDEPKFKKGSIFKNLVLLLWNSLKNSEYNDPKVYSMFRSKTFRPECTDLISLIEDSRDTDPGVIDRMSLFFVSTTVSSRKYFQEVINVVTSNSNEDIKSLLNHAVFQCRIHSEFKDPVDSSTVKHSNVKIPVTSTIQSPANSDGIVQHFFVTKNPDGTFQQIPIINANTAVEPSIVTSQPLNNFCQSLPSSVQIRTHEPSTSKVMPENKCFVVTPTICHGPLVKVSGPLPGTGTSIPTTSTFVAFKSSNQNKKFLTSSPLIAAEGNTIRVGNKHYQLVKRPMPCQIRTLVNSTSTPAKPPPIAVTRCFSKNCNIPATVMCSNCKVAKYCTHACQEVDWYDSHINDCERMLNEITQP